MVSAPWSRRQFLQFVGAAGALTLTGPMGCSQVRKKADLQSIPFNPLQASYKDDLLLVEGLHSKVLISYNSSIGRNIRFGYNNDYLAFIPFESSNPFEGWLWVNHESTDPLLTDNKSKDSKITKAQVSKDMDRVGGSLLHIRKSEGEWRVVTNSPRNARFSAKTPIPFANSVKVEGKSLAIGTLANCAGGVTPWNTFLTCEENYQDYWGENNYRDNGEKVWVPSGHYLQWEKFYNYPTEHYGWVVEIDPKTKKAKKHTNLGRFSHESATVTKAKNGNVVVYSGDDKADEFIYKFISDSSDSFDQGTLYVADTKNGKWLALDLEKSPQLKRRFKNQLEVMIRCREAARLLGATPQNRPEDIEIDPTTGDILVCLTNNVAKGDYTGEILKIQEEGADSGSLNFKASSLITGGESSGFACPDNMVFDGGGNLWFTTDISGGSIGKPPYESFGNNALFYVPMAGVNAGFAFRVASAPVGAEFTGPYFSPDGETLFLSVQHPGEKSKDSKNPRSRWPHFGNQMPKPSVVTIEGPLLKQLTQPQT